MYVATAYSFCPGLCLPMGGTLAVYNGRDYIHYVGAYTGTEPFRALYEPPENRFAEVPADADAPPLEFFLSLRSPYTYLAVERTIELAERQAARIAELVT